MKKILVKDLLNVLPEDRKVDCVFYAYGCYYASSLNDAYPQDSDVMWCKCNLRRDCMNALVTDISPAKSDPEKYIVIHAEIVHD